jgi:hypothetical protein
MLTSSPVIIVAPEIKRRDVQINAWIVGESNDVGTQRKCVLAPKGLDK